MSKKYLFKEQITKKYNGELAEKLLNTLKKGDAQEIRELLFGNNPIQRYKGSFTDNTHYLASCNGFDSEKDYEKRTCKCMFYRNAKLVKRYCNNCTFNNKEYEITGDYKILDYEVPSYFVGEHIGEIDLIIKGGEILYATEVKPPIYLDKKEGNDETLLRMIAEILTYTYDEKSNTYNDKYKKAIAFFEGTTQEKEYDKNNQIINDILELADISVFKFIKRNLSYEIIKLK